MKARDEAWAEAEKELNILNGMQGVFSEHPSVIIAPLIVTGRLQMALAKINDSATRRVIRLTWAIVGLTVALLVTATVQTAIMFKENSSTYTQQIQRSHDNQTPATNQQAPIPLGHDSKP